MSRTSLTLLLIALLALIPLGCGGTEKGKNKDLDKPKAESAK